ncbi:SAV_2336 family protein [Streptomyces endophyticus]|uniref:SAV_2336 family protein n=1 Tax=Streptomyces endophyticus TaxID=714166 RepID=A0ABU6EWW9_9ACTN|nr:SAV_2336 N-terminal domain-related protein [Streptomyces endophyticus]MEB8336249.1 SAV_2336 family protein [Streptomyces endophyticus]
MARLRQIGLDPDAEGLCDALWLARYARPAQTADQQEPVPGERPTYEGPRPTQIPTVPDPTPAEREPEGPAPHVYDEAGDRRVALYPVPRPGNGRARRTGRSSPLPVGVPAAPAFPAPLELQRALRPLQGYRSAAPPLRSVLDETATAERTARAGGLVLPVFRAVTRADARLSLVMDASSSMRVWDRMFTELEQVFGQLGAFWDIQVSYLHEGPDAQAAVSRSPELHGAPLHSTDRLSDPSGRQVTLLISDCAGPLWRSGRAHRLLHQLARQAPAAVLQPLPQRMWNRTRLPVSYGELSRGEALGGAAALRVRTAAGPSVQARAGALPVPVLPPEPVALGAWARLLSGAGAGPVAGAVGWVRADQRRVSAGRQAQRPSVLELVSRFRSTASPDASRLAGFLAAAPLCLPVMQLVQRTMLPGSGPSELAEVLLSGLLTRAKEEHEGDGVQWYEFAPGVQEALLGPLGRDEAVLVLKHCSEYIEARFDKGGPNFPALALAQLGDGGGDAGTDRTTGTGTGTGYRPPHTVGGDNGDAGAGGADLVPQPFAEVAARVLERFMPLPEQFALYGRPGQEGPQEAPPTHPAVTRARALAARFDGERMVQDLIDAVQLLRGATEHESLTERDFELWAEYAHCVLLLWEVQGGAELLREAEQAAERAAAHPHALRERAVLARVLSTAATDRRRRGDRNGALELLRRADREYAVACSAPDLAEQEALRLTLERVGALEAQWRLGGDSALLQGAVGMLEAFVDTWPDRRHPPELPLAHGRILLRLSGAAADGEQAVRYAEQAAGSLRTALNSEAQDPGGVPRVRVLLDLVDALLGSGDALDEAAARVDEALAEARDQRLRAAVLLRAGRVARARHTESGDPRELQEAARHFEQAAHWMPRDSAAHADALAEWGEVLLSRAGAEPAAPAEQDALSRAIRVLRDCRSQTPAGSARLAHRLLLLGRALMLRYRARGDRVDLREAEYLLGLAAAEADDFLPAARSWLELGQVQFEVFRSLGRPARLDEAVDAFRYAAESARGAEREADTERSRQEAVLLGAQAHHLRGMTYEAAARPRAAREAYRAARREWSRLPDGNVTRSGPTARQTAERLAELD